MARSSQIKRQAVSPRSKQSGQVHISTASSSKSLTAAHVLSYLGNVKTAFQDRRDKYKDFLGVMEDFRSQRIDSLGVRLRLKDLFKGNPDLILGFNAFLPKEYEITLPLEDKQVGSEEAISFLDKIKTRCQDDDHVFKAFLIILDRYKKENKSITQLYQEVSVLFEDHADLLVEFATFIPAISGATAVQYAQSGRNHLLHGDDSGSPMFITRSTQVSKNPAVCDGHIDHHDSEYFKKEMEKGEVRVKNELEHDDSSGHKRKSDGRDDCATNQFDRGSLLYNKLVVRSVNVDRDAEDHDHEDQEKYKDHDIRERDRHERCPTSNTKDFKGHRMPSYAHKENFMSKSIRELDLSNSRCCTPSYRLLPENYPIPSASWRTDIGAKVLNDCWVSNTSGSEVSFKQRLKNLYEESLHQCEDDRFELDLLLKSVTATAKRVEELLNITDAHTYKKESSFSIEDHLSALHMRCIERLYGDHGLDVVNLLKENVPLVLSVILTRLKQKEEEWTRCRDDLNKVWAEIYAKNYHKSLDHRSFYFKQQDTKNLSTKVTNFRFLSSSELLSLKFPGWSLFSSPSSSFLCFCCFCLVLTFLSLSMDMAMQNSLGIDFSESALFAEIKEVSEKNQSEDQKILSIASGYKQSTKPHMEFGYSDLDIQKDIYQLMKYSCEEVCTPAQCDKIMKIWTSFLEPLLGVPSHPTSAGDKKHVVKDHTKKNLKGIDPEENNGYTVEVVCCKPEDMSRSGDKHIPLEDSFPSRPRVRGSNGNVNDGSPGVDNVTSRTDILSNASSTAAGEKNLSKENASATWKEADHANEDCRIEVMPSQEYQEDVQVQKLHEENETHSKYEREEGELSPDRNVEENNVVAFGNTDTNTDQILSKIEPTVGEIGEEEMCIEEAGEETNTKGEGDKSTQVSSDNENASGNGDVLGIESANRDLDENDIKAKSEREEDCMMDVHDTKSATPVCEHHLQTMKPLRTKVPGSIKGKEKKSRIFYGNASFYLLFRLHQMLYERMQTAKIQSSSAENKSRCSNGANSVDSYARFKDALYSLLNGSSSHAKFEDECQALLGPQSYILSTLDKLIHTLIKQLKKVANDEMDDRLIHLYAYERSRSPATFSDAVFYENARFLLPEDNLYRIEFLPTSMHLNIQLMKYEHDKLDPVADSIDTGFASYLNDKLLSVPEREEAHGVFLKRNKRLYSSGDEYSDTCRAMEGLVIYNGVDMKVDSGSSRIKCALGTEDFLYRPRKRRAASVVAPDGCRRRAKRRKVMLDSLLTLHDAE